MISTTREPFTLRPYQQEVIDDFTRWLDEAAILMALVSPTGSGKPVTLVAFLAGMRGRFRASVVATPSTIIEDGFARTAGDLLHRPRTNKASDRGAFTEYLSRGCDDYLGWLTTHQQLTVWGLEALPADLSRCLLVLDEAHHAGVSKAERKLNTEIGKLRETWTARGGIVIFVTATPFRTDKNDIMPPETRIHCRPAAVHALSGYAPDHWLVETAMLTQVVASTLGEFQGDDLSKTENKTGESFQQVIARWEGDGRPKAVFIVPPKNSRAWADRLILELTKAGARVHDAVGTDERVADKLNAMLATEREVKDVADSEIDVIVACRRFDEGADWPLCSHVYNYGIPRSLVLILQRFGRAQRDKQGIAGHTHPRTAKITFFVPRVSDDLLDKFTKDHHKLACVLGLVMERFKAGSDLSADINVQRHASWTSENKAREARGEAPLPRPALIRDDEMLDAESNLLLNLREMKRSTGQEPTEGTIAKLVEVQSAGKSESAQQVIAAAGLSLIRRANPASVRPGAEDMGDDFKAELARRMEESQDRTVTFDDGVFRVMSEILGSEAMERVGVEKPDLTEDNIFDAAAKYRTRMGEWPTVRSGDASLDFPWPESWIAVNAALVNGSRGLSGGKSLPRLLEERASYINVHNRPALSCDEILSAASRFYGRTGRWPSQLSGDASEDFGRSETWVNVNSSLVSGNRGLSGGSSLAKLLDLAGCKTSPHRGGGLTADLILRAARRCHERTGRYPNANTPDAHLDFDRKESWGAIDNALRKGLRGLNGNSCLAILLDENGLIRRTVKSDVLSTRVLIGMIHRYRLATGAWPSETINVWKSIGQSLRKGYRGLQGGSSLPMFTAEHSAPDGTLLPLAQALLDQEATTAKPAPVPVPAEPATPTRTRKPRTPRQPKATAMPVQAPEVEPAPSPVEPTPSTAPTVAEPVQRAPRQPTGRLGRWFGREGMALTGK